LAALVVSATCVAQASAKPHSFYGVSSQTPLSANEIAKMGKGGIGTLRIVIDWNSVDPTSAPGDYQWGSVDALVTAAAANRVEVLPFLFGTPSWVAKGLDNRKCNPCSAYAPRHKAALRAWRDFVAAAVARYGRGGEFWAAHPELPYKPFGAWQIWNEQNSKTFYAPRPTVKGYAKLLEAAAKAIQKNDRKADVVLGGMAELSGSRKAVAGPKYLRQLYRRRGAQRDFDGVAVHPYGSKVAWVVVQVDHFTEEINRAHDSHSGLGITVTCWGSANGSNPLEVGKRGQAKRLKETYRYFEHNKRKLHLKTVIWFSWRDSAVSICDWCASSGLLKQSGKPKPSFRAMKQLAR
jgi:hypothetical protein